MRRAWFILASMLLLVSSLVACGPGTNEPPVTVDGDETEVEAEDGDQTDGDLTETEEAIEDGDSAEYPDPKIINEVKQSPVSAADESYQEEKVAFVFANADGSPIEMDVRALSLIDDTLYIGTAVGLYKQGPGDAAPVMLDLSSLYPIDPPAIVGISATAPSGELLVAAPDALIRVVLGSPLTLTKFDTPNGETIRSLNAVAPDLGFVVTDTNVLLFYTDALSPMFTPANSEGEVVQAALSDYRIDGTTLYVGTNRGVYTVPFQLAKAGTKDYPHDTAEDGKLIDNDVQSLAYCGDTLVIGSAGGLTLVKGTERRFIKAELDHLPLANVRTIACLDDTALLYGSPDGAVYLKLDESHIDTYISQRWLADNAVQAVALIGDGTRLVGTPKGLSLIYLETRTLSQKAEIFDGYVPSFWRMDGFFDSDIYLAKPFDAYSTGAHSDKDNDGLWTQMMIGGWCMEYARTKNEKYYEYARKAMDNMQMLVDVPRLSFEPAGKQPGFITRSIVREDEGAIFTDKATQPNWHLVTYNGKQMYWKDDTSSDEYAGHFYGFPLFYDLCAKTDAERKEIADRSALAMDYVIAGGYKLLDLDGERTTHGHWDPDTISIAVDGLGTCISNGYPIEECASAFGGGGWLNSVEILGHLLATYHMTGEPRFYEAYDMLITKYRYDEAAMPSKNTKTIVMRGTINHSDHELAMLAYATLLRYEPNPERRAKWLEGLTFLYKYERPERNPLWAAYFALAGGQDPEAEAALRTLREMPDDLRGWALDNGVRRDAEEVGADRHGHPELDRVFPYDEIRTMWWNGNPYARIEGGDGRSITAPTAWLLAYYTALYSGLIH